MCGAFLCPGGALVVSEPPEPVEGRWPTEHVQSLGLSAVSVIEGPPRFVTMKLLELPAVTVPRSWPQIVKNPLFWTVSRNATGVSLKTFHVEPMLKSLTWRSRGAEISEEAVYNTTVQRDLRCHALLL